MQIVLDASDLSTKGVLVTNALRLESYGALNAQTAETLRRLQTNEYWRQNSRKTGKSFTVRRIGSLHLRVESDSKIAHFLNVGTRAHYIWRNKAPALTFFWAKVGRIVSFIRVRHPGTKGLAYDQKEAFRSLPELLIKGDTAAERAVSRAGLR